MSQSLSSVTFHGDTIFCITIDNQPYTPAKPIVENMGLAWQAQRTKLAANKDRWGITMIVIPSSSGEQETLCIPVRKLPAFFASINPKKVRAELRPKIELYQNECDDALWNYWVHGQAIRSFPLTNPVPLLSTVSSRKPLEKLMKVWAARSGIPHAQCWTMLDSHFCLADINDLPAEKIPEAIAWVQTRIDALPMVPAKMTLPPAAQKALPAGPRFDEEEFLAFAEECRQAHAEIWNIRERITDRASTLHTELMGYLVFREPACTPDRGVALELNKGYWRNVYRMCWEFLTSASQHVDDYNNPALYMLKLAKHMNAEECAER